ncbi:MAG: GIY-YIG nuclease family protein [Smithella sp.]|jgi:putative endonuclease|nr:GIY-YIG nuclease family protein [Smithellaceae bacterium]NLA41772.1 GIY-YIG nuclease family protein [Smithella sp.]
MKPKDQQKRDGWAVYLICCSDGSFYTGATNCIERRLREHNSGKASKYTRARRPVTLLAVSGPMSRSEALSLERKIKNLPRTKKITVLTTEGYSTFQKCAKQKTAFIVRKKERTA